MGRKAAASLDGSAIMGYSIHASCNLAADADALHSLNVPFDSHSQTELWHRTKHNPQRASVPLLFRLGTEPDAGHKTLRNGMKVEASPSSVQFWPCSLGPLKNESYR